MNLNKKIIERFWSKVTVKGPDDCWEWTAGRFQSGYGAFSVSPKKLLKAHRVAFFIMNGAIPSGAVICHACDNRSCCNPKHLWAGSVLQNVQDRDNKNRQARGETQGATSLTTEKVLAIRADKRSQRKIAKEFGVCKSTVGNIRRGEYWRHV